MDDSKPAALTADHAYWLADLRVRNARTSPRGTIDALSRAFGVGDAPRRDLSTTSGTLNGGSHGSIPYVRRAREWGAAPSIAKANRADVNVTNLASGTLDARRARLTCNADIRLKSDGPFTMRVGGCPGRVVTFGCLARRSPIGRRNIGRIRLGRTRTRLLQLRIQPRRRTRYSFRWCVNRDRGRVTAVFSSRKRRGKAVLVTTTARLHRKGRVGRGVRLSKFRRTFPHRRRIGRGLYRASPRSRRIIGIRHRRVRFMGVADKRLLRHSKRSRRALRRSLRRAGL